MFYFDFYLSGFIVFRFVILWCCHTSCECGMVFIVRRVDVRRLLNTWLKCVESPSLAWNVSTVTSDPKTQLKRTQPWVCCDKMLTCLGWIHWIVKTSGVFNPSGRDLRFRISFCLFSFSSWFSSTSLLWCTRTCKSVVYSRSWWSVLLCLVLSFSLASCNDNQALPYIIP